LARLVGKGVVMKRRHDEDRRALTLHLTTSARREYQRFASAITSYNAHGRGK
jgi:DNA-binding MarR family transcriptional regulator